MNRLYDRERFFICLLITIIFGCKTLMAQPASGYCPIETLVRAGNDFEAINVFRQEPRRITPREDTILHLAVRYNRPHLANGILVAAGEEDFCWLLTAINRANETALHIAAERAHIDLAQMLLDSTIQHQTDIMRWVTRERNGHGATALMLSIQNGHDDIAKLLLSTEYIEVNTFDHESLTPLILAIARNKNELVRKIVESGAQVNTRHQTGISPLGVAAVAGNFNGFVYLLNMGACLHCQMDRILVDAASGGNVDIIRFLIDRGADPNSEARGSTPLLAAISLSRLEAMEFLLRNGADVNMPGYSMQTPLHLAVKFNRIDFVHNLIRHGANIRLVDNEGRTPIELANELGYVNISAVLKASNVDTLVCPKVP